MKAKLAACFLACIVAFGLTACAPGTVVISGNQTNPSIYLYGETHSVPSNINKELESWKQHYHEGMRHLFVELPYYTAEFYNLWMQADNDDILEACYADTEGTAGHSDTVLEFYKNIKRECPETIFHGTDVGHQYDSTGSRFLRYLEENNLQETEAYARAQQNIEQGIHYYESNDDVYRENTMVENFIREFDALNGQPIMGVYGSAHTKLDGLDFTQSVAAMATQLKEHYGDIIYVEDLSGLG